MRIRAGQVALAVAASRWSVVNAQAFYGSLDAELSACGSDNFISLGCFPNFDANAGTLFSFTPHGYNIADPSFSFPGWDPGDTLNNTETPLDCARVCRGFGFKFSSMLDNSCHCGTQLPAGYSASGTAVCNVPCQGDEAQTCGGTTDAQVYVDPTYANDTQVPVTNSNPTLAAFYKYLGCYNDPNGFPTNDTRASATVADIATCLDLCAGLGYPLAHGSPAA